MVLDSFFNAVFGSIVEASPLGAILLISFILTLIVTLVYKFATDQKKLKALREEMNELRKKMKENKNDQNKLMEIQKESMTKSMEQLKHTLKPTLFTFIPLIIIFGWLRATYDPIGALIGPLTWIWVYILSSMIFSMVLRKGLKVY